MKIITWIYFFHSIVIILRCFFGINPESGTKVKKSLKWTMNIKVTKLIEMLGEEEELMTA